jgi:hypothetical protein
MHPATRKATTATSGGKPNPSPRSSIWPPNSVLCRLRWATTPTRMHAHLISGARSPPSLATNGEPPLLLVICWNLTGGRELQDSPLYALHNEAESATNLLALWCLGGDIRGILPLCIPPSNTRGSGREIESEREVLCCFCHFAV